MIRTAGDRLRCTTGTMPMRPAGTASWWKLAILRALAEQRNQLADLKTLLPHREAGPATDMLHAGAAARLWVGDLASPAIGGPAHGLDPDHEARTEAMGQPKEWIEEAPQQEPW